FLRRNPTFAPNHVGLRDAPHLNPLDETTSHSTRLPETAAKSLVIPQAGEEANVKSACCFLPLTRPTNIC
ncbi:MAG: hypothetical protein NUV63_11520, partial [Gallionella sp.]|nr:hypothetical protein [Gallionella sp.]